MVGGRGLLRVESESFPSSVFPMAKLNTGLGTWAAQKTGQTEWNGAVTGRRLWNSRSVRSDPERRRARRTGVDVLWRLKMGGGGLDTRELRIWRVEIGKLRAWESGGWGLGS